MSKKKTKSNNLKLHLQKIKKKEIINNSIIIKNTLKIVITCFVIVELYFNASVTVSGIMNETGYAPKSDYIRQLISKRELLEYIDDDMLYRISDYDTYTYNDGSWLGYNGIGYFSSCYNLNVMEFFGKIGEDQSKHVLVDGIRTPLEEAILGVKYRISNKYFDEIDKMIAQNELYSISENNAILSLGYMVHANPDKEPEEFGGNAFENQNTLAKELSGVEENVFVELEQYTRANMYTGDYAKKNAFTVETEKDATIWLYVEQPDRLVNYNEKKDTKLVVDGFDFGEFVNPGSGSSFIRYIGKYTVGERIDIELFGNVEYGPAHVVYMDEDVYKRVIDVLGERQLAFSEHANGHFDGTIDAGTGGNMLLTLPAIEGWIVKGDGERIIPNSYRNVFLSIPLSGGIHEMDVTFVSPGILTGCIIGCVSLVIALFIGIPRKEYIK